MIKVNRFTGLIAALGLSVVGSASLSGCAAEAIPPAKVISTGGVARGASCGAAVEKPHDPTKAAWSYHEAEDGPARWGSLPNNTTCGAGAVQTPIDLVDGAAVASAKPLAFAHYDREIPIALLNNGHTIQVNYAGTQSAEDPQITYDGKTFYLLQFHWHSSSEHVVNGRPALFEVHFVHKAADGALAVVGVLFKSGGENDVLGRLMSADPGHDKEATCADTVKLDALLPAGRGFYHYTGSLTTPPCSEGLSWFVMTDQLEASTAQETAYKASFHGATNRPLQPLNGRKVDKHAP